MNFKKQAIEKTLHFLGTKEVTDPWETLSLWQRSSNLKGSLRKLKYLNKLSLNHQMTNRRKEWYFFFPHPNYRLILRIIEFRAGRDFSRHLACFYEFAFIFLNIFP